MDILTCMKVFAAVIDTGSFVAASERLAMSRAMTSKYVAHLEDHLGTRLIQRTTRKLALTEFGAQYYERCTQILADIREVEEGAGNVAATARGTLRMTLPVSFGILHMGPVLSAYLKQYPEVRIDMMLADRRVDLIEEGLDLALRIGIMPESDLIARKVASSARIMSASPDYLAKYGTPRTPADLAQHNCLSYAYAATGNEWKMSGPDGAHSVKVSGSLRANNGDMVKLAAVNGVGLMREPLFLQGDEIRSGQLVEVMQEYQSDDLGIYLVYPSRKHLSAKVRTFVDFVADAFSKKDGW